MGSPWRLKDTLMAAAIKCVCTQEICSGQSVCLDGYHANMLCLLIVGC